MSAEQKARLDAVASMPDEQIDYRDAAASVKSLSTGWVPPMLNCDELDPKCVPLNLIRYRAELRPKFVMTHAIGFGGYYYAAHVLGRGC